MFDSMLQAIIQGVLLGGYYAIIAAGLCKSWDCPCF